MFCAYCKEEIKDGEEKKEIYKCEDWEAVVHDGKCFEEYGEEHLYGKSAKERGHILGLCCKCMIPIRSKDHYFAFRNDILKESDNPDDWRLLQKRCLTTIPNSSYIHKTDSLMFIHNSCSRRISGILGYKIGNQYICLECDEKDPVKPDKILSPNDAETVEKSKISGACSNGWKILDQLIKKGVVHEISPREVIFFRYPKDNEIKLRKIAKNDFDKIWTIFEQVLNVQCDRCKGKIFNYES